MRLSEEDIRHSRETGRRSSRADEQQRLATQAIDQRHANQSEDQVGCTNRNGLQVAGQLREASGREDVVQVIENRVDTRQLVKSADGDSQKQWIAVFPLKDRLIGHGVA